MSHLKRKLKESEKEKTLMKIEHDTRSAAPVHLTLSFYHRFPSTYSYLAVNLMYKHSFIYSTVNISTLFTRNRTS